MTPWLLLLIPAALALAWGLERLPVRGVTEVEMQDHAKAMQEWRDAT